MKIGTALKKFKITYTEHSGEREYYQEDIIEAHDEDDAADRFYKDFIEDPEDDSYDACVTVNEHGQVYIDGEDNFDVNDGAILIDDIIAKEMTFFEEKVVVYPANDVLLGDPDETTVDYAYCLKYAALLWPKPTNYAHEFILQVHTVTNNDDVGGGTHFDFEISRMKDFGCSEAFLELYTRAWETDASRLVLAIK